VRTSIFSGGEAQETVAGLLRQGLELTNHLIAEMLVEPEVTPEDVASGMFHELDLRMLIEFAQRVRDRDAAGKKLPIVVLDPRVWQPFPGVGSDPGGARDGGANGADAPGGVPDADGGDV
jgi:hypothetical protein